jgi:SRSO17 transposase
MEPRYDARMKEMLAQAEVPSDLIDGFMGRLESFALPFSAALSEPEQRQHTVDYISGLLSKLDRKTAEAIAYLHDQERQGLQKFMGHVPWDHQPLLMTLARQVGSELGASDGVIVFDPSGFPKKGTKSVGVARQWCGRIGKVDNCQIGIYMAYVSRKEQAIVNMRLYLPEEWAKDRRRCNEAGVPTRHALALQMLDEQGALLPHSWIAGDDEMGRPASFRKALRDREQRYLLAIPSNTLIRDGDTPPPPYSGHGRRPKSPFTRVDSWCAALRETSWTTIDVRDGEKGPLIIDVVKCRVQARTETGGTGPDEVLFITREKQADGTFKHDYYLSNSNGEVELKELARVTKAAHRIEECFERAKGEAGLADYQVRNWIAWHHHQTLSLLAAWFLNQETRRGKNTDPGNDLTTVETVDRRNHRGTPRRQRSADADSSLPTLAGANRASQILSSLRT